MIQNKIRSLKEQGYSNRQIVSILGTSLSTVSASAPNPEQTELGIKIVRLREEGKSYGEIKKITKASKATISKWCNTISGNNEVIKQKTEDELNSRTDKATEQKNKEKIKNRPSNDVYRNWKRQIRIDRITYLRELFGNKCQICGYNKSQRALNFHHVNESSKQFNVGGIRAEMRMERLLDEVSKCVLICTNCHAEIHDGTAKSPDPIKLPGIEEVPRNLIEFTGTGLGEDIIEREKEWVKKKLEEVSKPKETELSTREIDLSKITVSHISRNVADNMCRKYHYLGASHKGGFKAIGCFYDGELIGAAVITNPVNSHNDKCCEISRFILKYNVKNLASKFLSLVIKELKSDKKYELVQSFSDNENHLGTIYKAANFKEVEGKFDTYNYSGIHKKTIYMRARSIGISEHRYAEEFGLERVKESSKTKFVYSLV